MKKILGFIPMFLVALILTACAGAEIKASSLVVLPAELVVFEGKEVQMEVLVLPADTTNKELIWSSSAPSIATVSEEGKVFGVSLGSATITVKVKNAPEVFKDIVVSVIEKQWPAEEIEHHFGFNLPEFPEYSSITVSHLSNGLKFVVAGYENDEAVLSEYITLLTNQGWVANISNDHHLGSFTHPSYQVVLAYHNNESHGHSNIEFTIKETSNNEGINWEHVNEEVEEHYGFTLPEFPEYTTLEVNHDSNEVVEIVVKGFENDEEALNLYFELLSHNNWVASSSNNSHVGKFTKAGFNGTLNYHNSTSHGTKSIEFTIVPELEYDIYEDWTTFSTKADQVYIDTLALPAFPQFSEVWIKNNTSYGEVVSIVKGIENRHDSIDEYLTILSNNGWVAQADNDDHAGSFKKGYAKLSYHISHSDMHALEIKVKNQISWQDINDLLTSNFGFALSQEVDFDAFSIRFGSNSMITVTGFSNESLQECSENLKATLENDGWTITAEKTTDKATKNGFNGYISITLYPTLNKLSFTIIPQNA